MFWRIRVFGIIRKYQIKYSQLLFMPWNISADRITTKSTRNCLTCQSHIVRYSYFLWTKFNLFFLFCFVQAMIYLSGKYIKTLYQVLRAQAWISAKHFLAHQRFKYWFTWPWPPFISRKTVFIFYILFIYH